MSSNNNYSSQYKSRIAYPTILLAILAIITYVSASIAAIEGYLGAGWAIAVNSVMTYLLFTPMHEAGHMNIAENKTSSGWVNEVIGWLSSFTLFAPFYIFKVIHFRHHAYTNDPKKDPDHWLASKNWLSLLFHSTTIFPVYIVKAFYLLFFEDKIAKKIKKELKIGFIALFVQLVLLILISKLIGWSLILSIWVVPALIAQVFLAIIFDWLPHHPHEEKSRYLNARVFDIPGLSFLFLGQNYHLIHHLHPRIPFYDYKKVFTKIKSKLVNKGTDIISLENKYGR